MFQSMFKSIFLAVVIGFGASSAASAQDERREMSLIDLVIETKKALQIVSNEWESPSLSLDYVTLEINTQTDVQSDGSIGFYVVDANAGISRNATNIITLRLEPPEQGAGSDTSAFDLSQVLANAILGSVEAITEAQKGKPILTATEYSVKLRFAVERSWRGGLSLQFPPFSFGARSGAAEGSIHSIIVVFSK